MTLHLGIFMALACAFATNLGFLYKYRGARDAASVDIRHPLRSAGSLFGSKWFAIGMLVATGAWGFHVVALSLAPMSVVQVVLRKLGRGSRAVTGRLVRAPRKGSVVVIYVAKPPPNNGSGGTGPGSTTTTPTPPPPGGP